MTTRLRLLPAVRRTVKALRLGPEDAGLVRVAEALATSIDEMDDEMRPRMLGQTIKPLIDVLTLLGRRAAPVDDTPRQGLTAGELATFLAKLEDGDGSA